MSRPRLGTAVCAALLGATSLAALAAGPWQDLSSQLPQAALADRSMDVLAGDADGDGDLDLFGAEGLFVNRSHQLHAPLLLRPGYDWLVEAFASFAPAGTTDIALPWLSTTRMAIPVPPLGTLGIVPQVALPAMVVPQPAGVTSSTWPVPNAPALVGVSIYVQALQLSLPGAVRLSNVVADTLVH